MTPFELLNQAQRLGVDVVQFCDNLPLTNLDAGELDRFGAHAQELGLALELGTRGLDEANLRAHLELCRHFACSFLRLVVDRPGEEPTPEDVVARLGPMVSEFADHGVRIALENHDRFSSATLARIVQQLGCEHLGICLDTVNSFGALEGPEVVVETLAALTICLHVKDFTIKRVSHNMGFVIEGCAAGQGRLHVPWLLEKLAGARHPFNAILETWVSPGDCLTETIERERRWAEEGVRYLRGLIPRMSSSGKTAKVR